MIGFWNILGVWFLLQDEIAVSREDFCFVVWKGDAYYANKEIDKAIDDYETFLDLEKSDHKRMNEETKKFLTTEEGKTVSKEELKLALDFSQKSLELSPDNPDYLNTITIQRHIIFSWW